MFNQRINCQANGGKYSTRARDQIRATLDYGDSVKTKASRENHLCVVLVDHGFRTLRRACNESRTNDTTMLWFWLGCSVSAQCSVLTMWWRWSEWHVLFAFSTLSSAKWMSGFGWKRRHADFWRTQEKWRTFSKANTPIPKITKPIIALEIRLTELNKSKMWQTPDKR